MSGERDLGQLLGQLGQEQAPERSREQELERAEALAARLDRQLATLVAERRARRRRAVPLAAAAALLLGFGAWQLGLPRAAKLAIEQEPLPPRAAEQRPAPALPSPEPDASARPVERALPESRPRALPSSSSQAEPAPSGSAAATSTLGDENRLFKDAAEATRAGDTDGALRQLDRLLQDYPSSPLAQTALVRKLRLLAKAGRRDAAQQAAKRYLELYPTGFASNEAQELLRAPPTAPTERP